jgi:hypothetical protein
MLGCAGGCLCPFAPEWGGVVAFANFTVLAGESSGFSAKAFCCYLRVPFQYLSLD